VELNHELANTAFEAVLKAQRSQTGAELNKVLGEAFRHIGYSHFVAVEFFGPAADRQVRIIDGVNDLAWEAHYISNGFARLDPGAAAAATTTEPFFRSDLQARGQVSPAQNRVIEESRSFGIEDSFFAPQHHLDGTIGAVVLTAREPVDKSDRGRTAAHFLAVHYAQLVRRFMPAERPRSSCGDQIVLSRRQLECLKWVREGKSSSEIADILGVGRKTVDEYVGGSCLRLGVRTRVQAVARAMTLGMLPA
jgi:DNA-binding CsgD family transcriptional regulator